MRAYGYGLSNAKVVVNISEHERIHEPDAPRPSLSTVTTFFLGVWAGAKEERKNEREEEQYKLLLHQFIFSHKTCMSLCYSDKDFHFKLICM